MDGSFTRDPFDHSLVSLDEHASAWDDDTVVAANGGKVEKPLFVDVGDDEAKFVEMTGKHDGWPVIPFEGGDAIAQDVPFVGIGMGLDILVKDGLGLSFRSRRAFGVE